MTSCTHWHEMTKDEILIIFCYFFLNEKSRVFEDKSLGASWSQRDGWLLGESNLRIHNKK